MLSIRIHLLLVIASTIVQTWAYNSYMVTCPKAVRPGTEFQCLVDLLNSFPSLLGSLDIESGDFKISQSFKIPKGVSRKLISLDVPAKLPMKTPYELSITASDPGGNVRIKNTTTLTLKDKSMSVFIQTDKAIYKPGQTVQFRCIAVDPDLKTVNGSKYTMDIDIYDPMSNKIAQWVDVKGKMGVFQNRLKLSDQPPLGDWKIEVTAMDMGQETKTFTVEEYVLPKFEVSVSLPPFLVMGDDLTGMITAKYSFGKGVVGSGKLLIKPKWGDKKTYSLEFDIDETYNFRINGKALFDQLDITYPTTFEVKAEVIEALTGKMLSGSGEVQYYNREEKLMFLDGADNFKPGMIYTGYAFLSDQNDRPQGRDGLTLSITVTFRSDVVEEIDGDEIGPFMVDVPKNGMVKISFGVPLGVSSVSVMVRYDKALSTSKYLQPFESTSNTFIQVTAITKAPQAGKNATFRIQSTNARATVKCLIVARGKLVAYGTASVRRGRGLYKVMMTSAMTPSARLIVYYVRKNAEIIADSISFNVEGIFENKVDIDFSRRSSKPGQTVSLEVAAEPGSMCSVLTVDKSVLLLKSGNDITQDMVEDELSMYDCVPPSPCSPFGPCLRMFFPVPNPGTDAAAIFRESGVAVMTDAFLYEGRPVPIWRRLPFEGGIPMMAMGANVKFKSAAGPPPASASAPRVRRIFPETWLFANDFAKFPEYAFDYDFAMPEMEDAVQKSVGQQSPSAPRVRKIFPETWIFSNEMANDDGKCIINTTVPDTITTWVATAFAMHNQVGLGVAPTPANLRTFLNFFIRLELPYSVVRGEQVVLQVTLFNFYRTAMKVRVNIKRSEQYQHILVKRDEEGKTKLIYRKRDVKRIVKVPAGGGVSVNFPIKPLVLGDIDITVQATSSRAGDAVSRTLLVKPGGIPESYNLPILIDIKPWRDFVVEQAISFPDNVVPGSQRIRIAVIGDLMGPTINGLTNLLQMPYGCGEQNMINFAPNVYVINYLDAINNLKPEDLSKGQGFMMSGYQRELTYQHFDGSFSAFGNSDPSGSTWLTAFVVKSFAQAKPYIFIDRSLMKKAIDWLMDRFDDELGIFDEPGKVIHTEMQGGSASGEASLTAYTLIALLEARDNGFGGRDQTVLDDIIDSAKMALETAVMDEPTTYEISIIAYALSLSGSGALDESIEILESKATLKDGMMYWEVEDNLDDSNMRWMPPYVQARSRSIEVTSYALLTYAATGNITSGLKIIKWLVKQRNTNGGFGSTQDTVIALQALSKFAALVYSDDFDLVVRTVAFPTSYGKQFLVNRNNALLYQHIDLPKASDVKMVRISAEGRGTALAEIAVMYNVMEEPMEPLFSLSVSVSGGTINGFELTVCFSWLSAGKSSMVVMEIEMLSGFGADKFSVTELSILQRVDDLDTKLALYFDEITSEEECLTVTMGRESMVAGSQPAPITIYDYYQPEKRATTFYHPKKLRDTNVCDIGGC